ncbi:MAG: aminotransferase class III-fold pyridoxal phosphate-dependent enzyme [Balneolaceae bacterium]|nr:aminotransferase class III-fold pyridoxal phosphate-dependent enzyme [Balneolaceae bacterium]MBO6547236.1 aminotransferase class III-fold pyridoxal phosphate-dependent enzyme [Balneolaceae bacterium]MBO6647817.1 aminotransferase class III-fold pyridoxal phosphate-dependent enzyme [Balneolaceae bacterium]
MIKNLQKHFSSKIASLDKLVGYSNINYRLTTEDSTYIFKTYPLSERQIDLITAENEILASLSDNFPDRFPSPVPFKDETFINIIASSGKNKICRTLSFLEGEFLGDVSHSKKLVSSLGSFLAEMNMHLMGLNNYVIQARKLNWDIQHLYLNKDFISDIPDEHDKNLVRYFFLQFDEQVSPILPKLRSSLIHGDANEWNILTKDDQVTGLIDFGDVCFTPLINELAVAATYICYDKENPLEWAEILVKSYHQVLPLEQQELEILYYLIAARLCISVCNSAHAKKNEPENDYAFSSEENAWNMLYSWLEVNPVKARNAFFSACGYDIPAPVSVEQKVAQRHSSISSILSLSYDNPVYMNRSAFQYMYDVYGNTYLDAYNNIPHVGHSHPEVTEAGQKQMAKLNTNTRYIFDELADYAEKLLAKFPDSLNKVFFVNSGSAASDLAMRLAFTHTKKNKVVVMEHGYHGNTQVSIDISDYKFNNKKGSGQKDHILKTNIPDTFRGRYTVNDGSAGIRYAQDAIKELDSDLNNIAAFISEPIVGCGGQVPLANGYLKEIYPIIRAHGGLCISDEVQTGFGRLGDHFWGYEAQGVIPDIVVLGKPIANGHPMGAVVTTQDIAVSFENGVEFFSSFGGNPVSCAIASSVLDVIQKEELQKNAKEVGDYYKRLFRELQKEFPCIGDVRGSGLFLGIDIVKRGTKEPDTELAHHIKNGLREKHILISTDGPFDNVLKTKPPLCFNKNNADKVVETIASILKKNTKNSTFN